MMNTDFLIPMQAANLNVGDKVYLGEERFGKLLTCKTLYPITVADNSSQTEYTLASNETVYIPDPIMQYIIGRIPDYQSTQEYIQLEHLMAIINSADFTERFDAAVTANMLQEARYLYAKLFRMAHHHVR